MSGCSSTSAQVARPTRVLAAGQDGLPGAVPLPLPNLQVTATIGGRAATVQYAGGAQGIVAGVMQVNLQVPSGLAAGPQPVLLQVGGVPTQTGITIVVQ